MKDQTKPTVLWLNADRMGCGVYRVYCPAMALRDSGRYNPEFLQHNQTFDMFTGRPDVSHVIDVDAVVIQRAALDVFEEWIAECKKLGKPVIYETDDDLFRVSRHNPAHYVWGTKSARKLTRRLIKNCTKTIVSTEPLKKAIVEECDVPPEDVIVGYNHLRPEIWGMDDVLLKTHRNNNQGRIVIGWQGSATHDVDFIEAIPALTRILKDFPQTILRFFGYVPMTIKGRIPPNRFEWMKGVVFEQYPRNLWWANFDIGIAPLAESRFNDSKSAIKYLEYSACKVPTVASFRTPYKIITEDVNGFLCRNEEEWYEVLAALVMNEDRRHKVGQVAYDYAWSHWGPSRGQVWVDLFDQLLGGKSENTARGESWAGAGPPPEPVCLDGPRPGV